MIYQMKNVSGSTVTLAGVSVPDGEYFVFLDEVDLAANKVLGMLASASDITQMFSSSGLEYYEDSTLMTQDDYWKEISSMQSLASVPSNKWAFISSALNAQPNAVRGSEYFELESTSSGWKAQQQRVQLRQDRTDIPTVIVVGSVEYVNTNGLEVGTITADWFDVTFNAKGSSSGRTCSVAFTWEATYGG